MKNIVFMGTGPFALEPLKALYAAFGETAKISVYTKAPKPQGRGMKLIPGCVEAFAREKNLSLYQVKTLRSEEAEKEFLAIGAEICVVASYGLILPPYVLHAPKYGCVNLHASLLPRHRGAAPINRAVEAGDEKTGVTLMQMDEGLDTGDILWQKEIPITKKTTAGDVFDALALLAAEMIPEAILKIEKGEFTPEKQNDALSTYAAKITAEDQKIDWSKSAEEIDRKIRAFFPVPGAFCRTSDGRILKIWKAKPVPGKGEAGRIIKTDPPTAACGEGAIEFQLVQPEGKGKMTGKDAVNGRKIREGEQLL